MNINPYLNFDGKAEEAFNFYKSVFGGEFVTFQRMKDVPGMEALSTEEQNRMTHIALMIGTTPLMASDILPSAGHVLLEGNNSYIILNVESKDEANRIWNALSEGGRVEMPIADMFWGAYYGSFDDKFGIRWMINFDPRITNN